MMGSFSALDVARQLVGEIDDCSDDDKEDERKNLVASHVNSSFSKLDNDVSFDLELTHRENDSVSSCLGSSISCSEASFELARPSDFCSTSLEHQDLQVPCLEQREGCFEEVQEKAQEGFKPPSLTLSSHVNDKMASNTTHLDCSFCKSSTTADPNNKHKFYSCIEEELAKLDTNLPCLDFELLKKHLQDAKQEYGTMEKHMMMSEDVRRRLALRDDYTEEFVKSSYNVASHSYAKRLKRKFKNENLEMCFVNDSFPFEDNDDDDNDDWNNNGFSKSLSTPNLGHSDLISTCQCHGAKSLDRSSSNSNYCPNCGLCDLTIENVNSEMKACELSRKILELQLIESSDIRKQKQRLEFEAKLMLTKARQAAKMQMELEKYASKLTRSTSVVEEIIGFSLGQRKLNRLQLSRMCKTQLLVIVNDLYARIQASNEELVHLLVDRDSLHMEQDSKLIDIQDLIQHQKDDQLKIPAFLKAIVDSRTKNGINFKQELICKARSLKNIIFKR